MTLGEALCVHISIGDLFRCSDMEQINSNPQYLHVSQCKGMLNREGKAG